MKTSPLPGNSILQWLQSSGHAKGRGRGDCTSNILGITGLFEHQDEFSGGDGPVHMSAGYPRWDFGYGSACGAGNLFYGTDH